MKCLVFTLLLLLCAALLQAQQTDFSGTWLRNAGKCDTGSLSLHTIPVKLTFLQNGSYLQITRVSENSTGERSGYTEEPTIDGSSAITVVNANLYKIAVLQWSADHQILFLSSDYTDRVGKLVQQSKETWTLADEGKTLTVRTLLLLKGEEQGLTGVFDKK